jgi:hypothetical protein
VQRLIFNHMKLTKDVLKQLIKEEYMRGVPEFMVREVVEDCIAKLDGHIKRYIQIRAGSPTQANDLHENANQMFEDLKKEMFDLIESHMYTFMQKS